MIDARRKYPGMSAGAREAIRDAGESHHLPGSKGGTRINLFFPECRPMFLVISG